MQQDTLRHRRWKRRRREQTREALTRCCSRVYWYAHHRATARHGTRTLDYCLVVLVVLVVLAGTGGRADGRAGPAPGVGAPCCIAVEKSREALLLTGADGRTDGQIHWIASADSDVTWPEGVLQDRQLARL